MTWYNFRFGCTIQCIRSQIIVIGLFRLTNLAACLCTLDYNRFVFGVFQTYTPRSMPAASPNTTSSQSSNQSQSGEQLSRTNLYIRGLNPNTTDKDLVNLCQP